VLEAAVKRQPDKPLDAMDAAFREMCQQRDYMLITLQAFAAAADEEIRSAIRQRETAAFADTMRLTGASAAEIRAFFADGYLMIIGAALDIPEYVGEPDG
jgi:hypothetical protein